MIYAGGCPRWQVARCSSSVLAAGMLCCAVAYNYRCFPAVASCCCLHGAVWLSACLAWSQLTASVLWVGTAISILRDRQTDRHTEVAVHHLQNRAYLSLCVCFGECFLSVLHSPTACAG